MTAPVPLRYKVPFATDREFLAKFAGSVSPGGLFIATGTPLPQGTPVLFEFLLLDGSPVLAGEGKVVSVRPPPGIERPGMVLRFTRLDGRSRERIDRAIALREGTALLPPPSPPAGLLAAGESARKPSSRAGGASGPVLGIDLGTTLCRAAIVQGGTVKQLALEGRSLALASVVALDERGRLIVGSRAKGILGSDPKRAIFGAKRLLGRRAVAPEVRAMAARFPYEIVSDGEGDAAVRIGDRVLTPAEIAGYLLAEIRIRASEAVGKEITRAVIGAPAYFNERQRQAIRQAGELAGFTVERILSEPAAVGVAFGQGKGIARKRIFVFDLGGGTLDASVIEATGDQFEVLGAGGDNFLGGVDFDLRLVGFLEQRFKELQQAEPQWDTLTKQRVRDAAEAAKIALSERTDTRVHLPQLPAAGGRTLDLDVVVHRNRLDGLTKDLVDRAITVSRGVLEARSMPISAVDELVLVGGQSLAPLVRTSVEKAFGKTARRDLDALSAVATGAALVGASLDGDGREAFALKVGEVLTSAIGIKVRDGRLWRLLDRGQSLPCEKTCSFKVESTGLKLALYQGDQDLADQNEYLGTIDLPPGATGEAEIVLAVSRDGILAIDLKAPGQPRRKIELATADAPPEARAALFESEPLPGEPRDKRDAAKPGGFLKKLFGR